MGADSRLSDLLSEFSPSWGKISKKEKLWLTLLAMIILSGVYALYVQVTRGHGVTGMRDHVVWGIYIVNFIFFIGLGYSGSVIAALLYLSGVNWRGPIVRAAMIMMALATIIGPIFILLCIGRLDRLHHLFIYARLQSPIIWDVIAVMTYLVGCLIFLYLSLIKDFSAYAKYGHQLSVKLRRWYSRLSLGYSDTPLQQKLLRQSSNIMAVLIIPVAIIVSSILSWIFGMTLRPGWHSTIFGPYFVLAAIYSGIGVIALILYIVRKIYHLEKHITARHFTYLGYGIIIFGVGYGYFTFSEYFTDWYSSKVWEAKLIKSLFSLYEYGGWTFLVNFGGILLPIIVIGIPRLRSIGSIAASSFVLVISMWIKRYLIVVPTLENTLVPMQDLRPEYVSYSATWVEWALVAAGFAAFFFLFTLAIKFVTIIPVWNTVEAESAKTTDPQTEVAL